MSTRSFLVPALLFSALSLQAAPSCRPLNSFEQGRDLRQSQMTPAYNATARIDVRGSWDVYATGSYIFWQPREENIELGIINRNSSVQELSIDGRVAEMNFHYKSGLKAGLGCYSNRDNWDVYAEYTWLSGHQFSSISAPDSGTIYPFWGHPANSGIQISSGKGRWNLELNIADLQLARSYYVGSKLTFRPYFAARAAWINQKSSVVYVPTATGIPYHIRNSSHSWGVGPGTGISAEWLLGYGIRVLSSAEADILFTRYNLHMTEESSEDPSTLAIDLYQRHLYCLRPHSDLEIGLGWETYFDNHNYHFDILATYGFQIFWNQNMFRNFVNSVSYGKSVEPNGDLYIHGLTGAVRFDF